MIVVHFLSERTIMMQADTDTLDDARRVDHVEVHGAHADDPSDEDYAALSKLIDVVAHSDFAEALRVTRALSDVE
jgi:hypothetical protein